MNKHEIADIWNQYDKLFYEFLDWLSQTNLGAAVSKEMLIKASISIDRGIAMLTIFRADDIKSQKFLKEPWDHGTNFTVEDVARAGQKRGVIA